MIKTTDKIKARFDKYDKLSIVISFIFIAINVWLIFELKDYIFIGSIIPIMLFFIIMKIKVNNNNVYSIDDIDSFYNKVYNQLKKYTYYSFLLASFILLLFNYLLHFYGFIDVIYNNYIIPLEGRVVLLIYAEALFLGLFLKVATKLFKIVSPYDFRSSSIFNSKNKYLIRVWNFLYYRRTVYDCADGEKSYFKIWRENKNVIVADKISVLKKEIQSLNDDFLKKMYFYFLYPHDFGGISKMRMADLFEKIPKFVGFLLPFVIGYFFNDFKKLENILLFVQISVCMWLIGLAIVHFWNQITRKSLFNQLKVILPLLINEELENRKNNRKYKRPHRYK
ncbi:MAG: hypothetical protein Q3964_03930 [Carnobacterium sp.]|nr:hypothetical protein [Carnobacterium sp.]